MSMRSRLLPSFASRVPALSAIVLTVVAASAAAQDTTGVGAIRGVVVDAAGRPAEGVRVCALDTASCATSDARGVFRIGELRAGAYRLEILPLEGLPFTSDQVDVRAGLDGTVEITLPTVEDFQQTVTVTAPAFQAPEAVKNSGFLVAPREILKSAAALQDVSRYVQGLPGVVIGTNDFRNDIIVRGGSPLENLFVVDNVEIPNINAFANFASAGGTVSLLDAELLQDVTFLTGGYPAPFINRTSSVLQVTQREGSRKEFGGWATLGFAGRRRHSSKGPSVREQGPQRDRGWCRRDEASSICSPMTSGSVACRWCTRSTPRPSTTSRRRDRIWLVNIAGVDEIRLGLSESTDLDEEIANFDIRYDGWRSATGFNWQRTFGSRGVGLLGISHSEAKVGQQVKDLVAQGVPPPGVPPDAVIAQSPVVYLEDSREGETTVKYDLTLHLPLFDTVQAGGSFKTFRIDYTVESPYGNDTPYSPVAGIDPFYLDTQFRSYQIGRLPAGVETGGVARQRHAGRARSTTTTSCRRRGSARARASTCASPTRCRGTRARDRTISSRVPLRDRVSAERVARAVAGPPLRNRSRLVARRLPAADGRGVSKDVHRLSRGERPAHRVAGQHRRHLQRARNPLSARRAPAKGTRRAWSSSSRSGSPRSCTARATCRSRGRGMRALTACSGPARSTTPSSSIFSAAIGCRRRGNSQRGCRFCRAARSRPTTEAISTQQRRGVYDLTRVNAERAPDYSRIDIRVDRTFSVSGQPLNVFFGVQNVTNRRNFASYNWNRRTNSQQFGEQQGLFPILGFDWRF